MLRRHVNVAHGADYPFAHGERTGRAFQGYARAVFDVPGFPDGGVDSQFELLSHGDLNLGFLPGRAEDPHPFHPALGTHQVDRFLTGKLAGLGKLLVHGKLMPGSEQGLHVRLREVDVVGRNLQGDRGGFLGADDFGHVALAQDADGFPGDHPLFVGGDDQDPDRRFRDGDLQDLICPPGLLVFLFIDPDAHVAQALAGQAPHPGAALADAPGKDQGVQPPDRGHVGPNVLPDLVAESLESQEGAVIARVGGFFDLSHVVGDTRDALQPAFLV